MDQPNNRPMDGKYGKLDVTFFFFSEADPLVQQAVAKVGSRKKTNLPFFCWVQTNLCPDVF